MAQIPSEILDQTAHDDFDQATFRAFLRGTLSRLLRRDNDLLSFEHVRQCLRFGGQRDLGVQTVAIDQIIGSVGRYREFDRIFLPRRRRLATTDRWLSVDKSYYQERSLPAVELYKLGETFFVKDGNHRVSVARARGQDYIDARIIEIDTDVTVMSRDSVVETCGHQE
jgi:hypothetical protein